MIIEEKWADFSDTQQNGEKESVTGPPLFNRGIKFLSLYSLFQRSPRGGRRKEINRRNEQRRRHTLTLMQGQQLHLRFCLKQRPKLKSV